MKVLKSKIALSKNVCRSITPICDSCGFNYDPIAQSYATIKECYEDGWRAVKENDNRIRVYCSMCADAAERELKKSRKIV